MSESSVVKNNQKHQLPWGDDMILTLLNIVYHNFAHLPVKVNERWLVVNDEFFAQENLAPYKEIHYKQGNYRKLRLKYDSVLKQTKSVFEVGTNLSGYEGDRSKIVKCVEQILKEIEEHDSKKKDQKDAVLELKADLQKNESEVLEQALSGRKRPRSNTSSESRLDKRNQKTNSFEDEIANFLRGKRELENKQEENEEDVEAQILNYIKRKGYGIRDLVELGSQQCTNELLESLGLETVVNIFCSKGDKFGPHNFKKSLADVGVEPITYHRVYTQLCKWKRECNNELVDVSSSFNYPWENYTGSTHSPINESMEELDV